MRRTYGFLAAALALFASVAQAQNSGTVTNHAFAIGKGPGFSGYTSVLCGVGQLAIGQSAANPICQTMSGDGTLSPAGALALLSVNSNIGTFGDGTHVGQFTVDAKGRITAASSVLVTGAPPTGAAGGALSGTYPNPLLATMLANTTLCNATAGVATPTNCNAATMRTNIGVTATGADTAYVFRANNLSDLANAATARTNLGLVIGTNVEAWDADLDCLAALATTGVFKRTGAGTCSAGVITVSDGGTGLATLTANAFLTGNGTGNVNTVAITGLVLGNGASAPTAYGGTSACTNQFMTALSSLGVATCTTDTLASAQHANQGTTTTVLHGNAAGNPLWAAVTLTTDVTGVLPVANGGTGTSAAGQLPATATNDDASAGKVGEYVVGAVAFGSPVALTSTVAINITSISLTAGDWDVTGLVGFVPAATTNVLYFNGSFSTTSATLDTSTDRINTQPNSSSGIVYSAGSRPGFTMPTARFSLASTTTVYLVVAPSFSVSTMTGFGYLRARRTR